MARQLIASALLLGLAAAVGCSSKGDPEESVEPESETEYVTAPLPTGGIASQSVTLYPNTLVAAEQKLDWEEQFKLALNPEKAKGLRADRPAQVDPQTCSMCSEYCAVKMVKEYLEEKC